MKIVTIIGARPQFIKAAVVSKVIATYPSLQEIIVHTGQHFDENMSEIFFKEMEIPYPNYNLNVNGLTHGAMTGLMLERIEAVLLKEQPDWLLVYGDTNSTLAGALAAKKLHIKIAHVEAGLRSFNMDMPEEVNRILTDRISDILFCPSLNAVSNLSREGFEKFGSKICEVGDVMLDAALYYSEKARKPQGNIPSHYILCTLHRAENTNDENTLMQIFKALEYISSNGYPILFPLHPRTKNILEKMKFDFKRSSIRFIPPVGYLEMIFCLKNCEWVMTDSGGLQKEAYFFKKMCITLRKDTEWVELVKNGYNILAGIQYDDIIQCYTNVFNQYKSQTFNHELYGNGNAGNKIVNLLIN